MTSGNKLYKIQGTNAQWIGQFTEITRSMGLRFHLMVFFSTHEVIQLRLILKQNEVFGTDNFAQWYIDATATQPQHFIL